MPVTVSQGSLTSENLMNRWQQLHVTFHAEHSEIQGGTGKDRAPTHMMLPADLYLPVHTQLLVAVALLWHTLVLSLLAISSGFSR